VIASAAAERVNVAPAESIQIIESTPESSGRPESSLAAVSPRRGAKRTAPLLSRFRTNVTAPLHSAQAPS
jgi:hypothetical protein